MSHDRLALVDDLRTEDMYGNVIVPLGESGYGVSTTFFSVPAVGPELRPLFTFFHVSDGFRQSLFSVELDKPDRPTLANVFHDRIAELMASVPHG